MAIPSNIAGPILGAFISGLIGVGTVEYRNWRQGNDELRSWYDQTLRLAERIHRAETGEDDYSNDHARHVQATCAGVHSQLSSQVAEAPAEIEDEVLYICEELISDCQEVQILGNNAGKKSHQIARRMSTAADSAKNLIQKAEAAQDRVGLR